MRRRTITPLALLAACSLRPYTLDSATDASTTSTSSPASTTGTTSTSTSSAPTTTTTAAATTGGPIAGTWRGLYHVEHIPSWSFNHLLVDCETQQTWQLISDDLFHACGEAIYGAGLYLHVAGILRPDGDDPDSFDELEVTEFLAQPCSEGSCEEPFSWSSCGAWPDVCGQYKGCDPWTQDCPEGQKCMPYSSDGDSSWDSLNCFPVAPGGGEAGDPCTAEGGGVSGIDTCAKGHVCRDIDPDTGTGNCVPQCTGSPDAPMCPECTNCTTSGDLILSLCLAACSPLLQDCSGDEVCIANMDNFICVLDVSGDQGQVFDPCEYANACDPGLWCAPPDHASECDPNAPGCCLPFCDLDQPACPGAGQQCIPSFEQGQAPPCSANVGTCSLPP